MHKTLCDLVKGYIDKYTYSENNILYIEGWCFNITEQSLPLRVRSDTQTVELFITLRQDVVDYYTSNNIENNGLSINCGWFVKIKNDEPYFLEMEINNVWTKIFNLNEDTIRPVLTDVSYDNSVPSFVIVDNFYKEPDTIRQFAMSQPFLSNIAYHKGKRCINSEFRFPGLKEKFEQILNRKIINWDNYPVNGCFQYCIAEDKSVYHCDFQQYAGIIYLSPNAPTQTGTCFYKSKVTNKMLVNDREQDFVFKNGFYDSTQFELVDVVGNLYNRLILFNSKMIHAAPTYFGTEIGNARLFQLFFFDLEP